MSEHTRVSHPIYHLLPTEIEGFGSLAELALDMHWSWNHATDEVWLQLDPRLWEITHNPWVVLQTVSRDQAGAAAACRLASTRPSTLFRADFKTDSQNAARCNRRVSGLPESA